MAVCYTTAPRGRGWVEMIAQAALSGWGIAAGAFLALAAGSFALRGRGRLLGVLAGLSLASVLGALAIIATVQTPAPVIGLAGPPAPGAELIAEAERRLSIGDDRGAVESFNRALETFRGRGDLAGQGRAVLGLGRVEHFSGQGDAARAQYARALSLFQRGGSAAGEARVLVALGDLEMDTFQWDAAARYFREARQVWAIVPGPKSDPHVLLSLETVVSMPEGEEAAWAVLDQSALIFDVLGDVDGLGDVAMLRAALYATLGETHAALSDYRKATLQYREAGNRGREAVAAVRAAELEVLEGHNVEAVTLLDRADSSFADVEDPIGPALALAVRGDLARLLGDMAAASAQYAAAAEALRRHGHPAEAKALLNQGQVDLYLGNVASALPALEAAARLYAAAAQPRGEATAYLALGRLATASNDPDVAREHWISAVDLARRAGHALGAGRALLQLAELAASVGDAGAAQAAYDEAESKFAEAQTPMGAVLTALGRGDLARASSEAAAAAEAYLEAAAAFAAFAQPVAEANRYLGLPPVHRIDLVSELEDELGADEPDLQAIARLAAAREANLAAYPDHNLEGRSFLAEVEARIGGRPAAAE